MRHASHPIATIALAIVLAAGCVLDAPRIAHAADEALADEQLAARVEECSAAYEAAQAEVDELEARIDENEARVAEIEAELPVQRERAAVSVRTLYKFSQAGGGLLDLVLSANSFNNFLATIRYLDIIQARNTDEIARLVEMEGELSAAKAELTAQKQEADKRLSEAREALAAAEAARDEARRLAAQRAAAEAAEAQAALEAARLAAGTTFTTGTGNESTITTGTEPGQAIITTDDADSWAARIDAYLAGSPLSGHGRTFAEAALSYGVDPRWSPAIACIESGKGSICFRPYNAWGWGNASWPDWDSAIRSHVAGLASIYGYSITPSAARMYCPPNWQFWYSSVSAQMAII